MKSILKCPKCGKYTMKDKCCEATITTKPARYTKKHAEYRREARKPNLKNRGLL